MLRDEPLEQLGAHSDQRLAFHCPCTLQHAQKLGGAVESLLQRLGFHLTAVPDSHLCCGSAGTYSLTQPALARQLRDDKLQALESGQPDLIAPPISAARATSTAPAGPRYGTGSKCWKPPCPEPHAPGARHAAQSRTGSRRSPPHPRRRPRRGPAPPVGGEHRRGRRRRPSPGPGTPRRLRADQCYIATEKARTAALGRRETKAYEDMVNGGRSAFLSAPLLTSLEGGVPIRVGGQVVGAVGVSGVKAGEDAQVALAGAACLERD